MIDGSVLKELRRERGLSQEELGNLVGTEGNVISRWERGTSTPSLHYVHKLSEVLERPVDYLMKGEASDIKECSISENRGVLVFQTGEQRLEVPATLAFAKQFWERVDRMIDNSTAAKQQNSPMP
ncbi:MAG: helix-turn-helix transcriptional regulator [Synergistaceae bacterium]|nr:helix-turn-helix transcriptional regulator [Synergistaceae bacterium]